MKKYLLFLILAIISIMPLFNLVSAAGGATPGSTGSSNSVLCDIFPFLKSIGSISSICVGSDEAAVEAAEQIRGFVQLGLSLIFVGIIGISIFIIIRAAIKYIRSEGNQDKIIEAQKAIKSVFIGIGALFIGIIGIVIVLAFFQATEAINNNGSGTGNDFIDDQILKGF